jgi:hypothetical protein
VIGGEAIGRDDIMLLQDDDRIVWGASPGTALSQQVMEIDQRGHRHARRADGHSGAGDRIQHPGRHNDDDAGRHLDVNTLAASAAFAVVPPNSTPMQRMPAVMDLDLCLDMGRMTQRLRSAGSHGCSPGLIAAASAPRPYTA